MIQGILHNKLIGADADPLIDVWVNKWVREGGRAGVRDRVSEWVSEPVSEWVSKWGREGGSEGPSVWASEWTSECMSERSLFTFDVYTYSLIVMTLNVVLLWCIHCLMYDVFRYLIRCIKMPSYCSATTSSTVTEMSERTYRNRW